MWLAVGAGLAAAASAAAALGAPRRAGSAAGPPRVLTGARRRLRSLGLVARALERGGAARRREACERQMPEFLDILALGLAAGLSFDASLEQYCARRSGVLAREVRSALGLWQMGVEGRAEALDGLARRVGSPSLERFCAAVREALSFGAPLAATLERQAGTMREEQRVRTEERIEEVPVRMLVPLGTLVVPAMLLAILGPLLSAAMAS